MARTFQIPFLTFDQRTKLLHIAEQIVKHEDRFDMAQWYDWGRDTDDLQLGEDGHYPYELVHGRLTKVCGTAGCIAGWIVSEYIAEGVEVSEGDVQYQAKELLGLDTPEGGYDRELDRFFDLVFTDPDFWTAIGLLDSGVHPLSHLTAQQAAEGLRLIVDEAGTSTTFIYE